MATSPDISSLLKAADLASNLARNLGTNIALIIATFLTSLALLSWSVPFSSDIHGVLIAVATFTGVYFLVLVWQSYRPAREAISNLKQLGKDERKFLQPFIKQNRRTMPVNIMDAPTASLIAKGILSYATSTFPAFDAPVVIQNYAYEYLARHPHLIDLKKEEIGSAEYDESD